MGGTRQGRECSQGAWFRHPKLAVELMQALGESRIKEKKIMFANFFAK